MGDPSSVSIGQAAALFGLAPSTLRWWETQGVIPEPRRVNGRRAYTEIDLRRIGLAHLCCITGAMPLEQAAKVTSGSEERHWQAEVDRHIRVLEDKIRQLQAAHDYLRHLVQCPDVDIVNNCPYLDEELVNHTPRRLSSAGGLVSAAQNVAAGVPSRGHRDEILPVGDERPPAVARCKVCSMPLPGTGRGRPRMYCSRACRQRHYRETVTAGVAASA